MTDHERALADLHGRLGLRRLSPTWAKLEILLGLLAVGAGLFLGQWSLSRPDADWAPAGAGLALFVLGGYLALAGHRSHLYQSSNALAAHLAVKIESLQDKGRIE
jgi:hypothetical protein